MFLFISDIHIDIPPEEHLLPQKLDKLIKIYDIDAIFFLGDIFEFWWGDDHLSNIYKSWETYFKSISIDKYFICGNRDFLIGPEFCKKTEINQIPGGSILQCLNKKIALFHGDEDALIDPKYHIFKNFIRHPAVKKLWFLLPEHLRRSISKKGRQASFAPSELPYNYQKWLDQLPSDITHIIHGHCHAEEKKIFNGVEIISLGDWYLDKTSILGLSKEGCSFLDTNER